jgi:PAS domain-containing protein
LLQSEQELENKNRLLNEAQHIAQLGSWEWDLQTNEVLWSDEMYHIYGYGKERFRVTLEKAMERMIPIDAEMQGKE